MLRNALNFAFALVSKSAVSKSVIITALVSAFSCGVPMLAQVANSQAAQIADSGRAVVNRLTSPIVDSSRVTIAGSIHPLATKANDRGVVSDSLRLERLQVVLKRSDAQEAELKRVLTGLHSAGSVTYHKWLTPDDFGKRFGPSEADVATLQRWLQGQGFAVTKLQPGRQVLEIAGTAGQLRNSFHTQLHQYAAQGEMHYANANAPEVPAALAPVFGGFVSLNNFRMKSHAKTLGTAQLNTITHESKPDWTIGSSSRYNLVLAPGDFAVQYDLNPVYAAGTKGDGQTIAVVNASNINVALVNQYRSLFGLPANPPQVIIDGSDPGVDGINSPVGPNGFAGEAYLDVELAGAVAPNAQIDLVIANDTAVSEGLTLAIEHAVFSNIAPVISVSFGQCEANQGSFNTLITGLWEQAAAQGQTVLVSTGDNGSAGCDFGTQFAVHGQAVSGLASTPYNVAVGGTDFYYSGGSASVGNYWNLTPSNTTPTVSLTTPVPEQPWNDSQYGLNLFSVYDTDGTTSIAAASGGPSTLGVTNSQGTPTSPHPKPSWQTGVGVPQDGARDLPDVSLFASNGLNNSYYPICAKDADCQPAASGNLVQISGIGGTSASTPAFAGMMALINQRYGRQGQANYVLYPLAAQFPSTFHDVTAGTISVPCATTTVNTTDSNGNITHTYAPKQCKAVSSPLTVTDDTYGQTTEGQISVDGITAAYNAGTGYDLATGLGTVDANNLITNWGKITLAATTTTLTPSATAFAHGTSVTISGRVTGAITPTGDVSLLTTSTDPSHQAETFFTLGNGAYSGSVNFLPGGSYNISGYFPGDGVNGPSNSTPVAVTVTPESSTTSLQVLSSLNPLTALPSGGNVSYGAPAILSATPAPGSGNASSVPTGSVTFLDGSSTINAAAVNVNGYAQSNVPLAVGSHSITAKYSGDSSYGASTSPAASFTVTKNSPDIFVTYTNRDQNNNPVNGQVTYLTVQVENSASLSSLAAAPTGAISVTGAPSGTTTSATLVSGVDPYNNAPQGTAVIAIPASAAGTYNIAFSYAGDTNYASVTTQPRTYTFDTGGGTATTTTTASATASSTSPTSLVTVNVTVTSSGSTAPTGTVQLYASEYVIASAKLPSASGTSASLAFTFDSGSLFQGTNQITVQYFPLSSAFGASATTVSINNPLSDFSMVPVSTILTVPASGEGAGFKLDDINLSSINGFSGAISFSCASAAAVTCEFGPATATLSGGGTASTTLLVDTGNVTAPGSYNVVVTGKNAAGTVIHTLGITVVTHQTAAIPRFTLAATGVSIAKPGDSATSTVTVTPTNGLTGTVNLTCTITGAPVSGPTPNVIDPTCAATTVSVNGTGAVTTSITVNTDASTPAGTYSAFVNGTSGSAGAIAPFALTVGPTAAPSFTVSGTAVTIASQGASGTSTITVTPAGGFTGTVNLTCTVTSAPSGAVNSPSCSAGAASVTGFGAATATLTINTTAQSARLEMPSSKGIFTAGGGVALGAILFFGVPFGRRRKKQLKSLRGLRMLSLAVLFAFAAGAGIGCGSGSSSTPPPPSGGTTLGSYTLTVTGTSGTATATTTIAVTVN